MSAILHNLHNLHNSSRMFRIQKIQILQRLHARERVPQGCQVPHPKVAMNSMRRVKTKAKRLCGLRSLISKSAENMQPIVQCQSPNPLPLEDPQLSTDYKSVYSMDDQYVLALRLLRASKTMLGHGLISRWKMTTDLTTSNIS